MARTIYQIKPIDVGAQRGVGILLPMNKSAHANSPNLNSLFNQSETLGQSYDAGPSNGGSVFAQSYSTEEQAISNLKNLLLTSRGERIMQPTFGTRIREAVFQPNSINLQEFINETLTESINKWLPYININSIDVTRHIDQEIFYIRLNFSVTEVGANRVIVIMTNEENVQIVTEAQIPTGLVAVDTFGDEFASGAY
jgi:phage baseplate assembly protein W